MEEAGQGSLLDPSAGGVARARKLTPEQRSAIAQRAARARWDTTIPSAEFQGTLAIADSRIECAVLTDGTRVLAQGTVLEALGRAKSMGRRGGANDKRAPFLSANNLEPFISEKLLSDLTPIEYRIPGSRFISVGYKAETLPGICEVYLAARAAKKILPSQENAAAAAEILVRSLAQVGVIALVDEVTGYQSVRARDELQLLLEKYVEESFRPWVKMFPDEFFKEIYRLYQWDYRPGQNKHGSYVGRFISMYIYDQLAPGVSDELRRVNPANSSGNRSRRHHQHLTATTGNQHLDRQITTVLTLMQVSKDLDQFHELFRTRFPHQQKPKKQVMRIKIDSKDEVQTLFELEDFN